MDRALPETVRKLQVNALEPDLGRYDSGAAAKGRKLGADELPPLY